MAISGTTGARIPTLTLTLVSEVQDARRALLEPTHGEHQAIREVIRGEHQVIATEVIRACLWEVLRHGEALRFQVDLRC
jgi:hypothetical protein